MERSEAMKEWPDFDISEEREEVRLQRGELSCSINSDEMNSRWGFFCGMGRHPNINQFMPLPQWMALLMSKFRSTDNAEVPLGECRDGLRRYLNMDSTLPTFRNAHVEFWKHFMEDIDDNDLLTSMEIKWESYRGELDRDDEEADVESKTIEIPKELLDP